MLCLFDTEAGVIELGQAVSFGWRDAVASRKVDRAWRAMRVPSLSYDVEEVVPVSPVPHDVLPYARFIWLDAAQGVWVAGSSTPAVISLHRPGRCRF
jgi:hypothetical protein